MKVGNIAISTAYVYPIVIMSILIIVSSFILGILPYGVLVAVLVCVVAESLFRKALHQKSWKQISLSAIITGLIIGGIAPQNPPLLLVAFAGVIAIASKFVLKWKHVQIFNPAALGLLLALAVFASSDVWWAETTYSIYGFAVSLAPFLIMASWQMRRLPASFAFVFGSLMLGFAGTGFPGTFSPASIIAVIFSINYMLAFLMLADPKTSPQPAAHQIIYGLGIAVLIYLVSIYHISYPILVGLLAGNLLLAFYRIVLQKRTGWMHALLKAPMPTS